MVGKKKKKKQEPGTGLVPAAWRLLGGLRLFYTWIKQYLVEDLQNSSSPKLEAEKIRDNDWGWEDSEMV